MTHEPPPYPFLLGSRWLGRANERNWQINAFQSNYACVFLMHLWPYHLVRFDQHAVNHIWFESTECNTTSHASVFSWLGLCARCFVWMSACDQLYILRMSQTYKLETSICKSIFSLATKAAGTCGWPKHVVKWCPFNNWQKNPQQQVRSRGRPPKRWDDNSKFFFAQRLTQKGCIVPGARFFSHEFSRATVLVTCLCAL